MRFVYPLLAMSAMLMTGFMAVAQNPDSAKITTLLQHAKEHAAQANLNAERSRLIRDPARRGNLTQPSSTL